MVNSATFQFLGVWAMRNAQVGCIFNTTGSKQILIGNYFSVRMTYVRPRYAPDGIFLFFIRDSRKL